MFTVLSKQPFLFVPHNIEDHINHFMYVSAYLFTLFIESKPPNCIT
jgi:hypothetical protein